MKGVLLGAICTIAFAQSALAQAPQCTVPNTLATGITGGDLTGDVTTSGHRD